MWTGAGTQFGFDSCVIMLRLGARFTHTCPRVASEGLADAQTGSSSVENSRSKAGGRKRDASANASVAESAKWYRIGRRPQPMREPITSDCHVFRSSIGWHKLS